MNAGAGSLIFQDILDDLIAIDRETNGAAQVTIVHWRSQRIEAIKLHRHGRKVDQLIFFVLTLCLLVLIDNIMEELIGQAIHMVQLTRHELLKFDLVIEDKADIETIEIRELIA